jgi:hypothetical protein
VWQRASYFARSRTTRLTATLPTPLLGCCTVVVATDRRVVAVPQRGASGPSMTTASLPTTRSPPETAADAGVAFAGVIAGAVANGVADTVDIAVPVRGMGPSPVLLLLLLLLTSTPSLRQTARETTSRRCSCTEPLTMTKQPVAGSPCPRATRDHTCHT